MIQPGVARRDFSCGGCQSNFTFAKEFPILFFQGKLAIRCPLCDYFSLIRINANSQVEILSDELDYPNFFQDEEGLTYKKDQLGNFVPTPLE